MSHQLKVSCFCFNKNKVTENKKEFYLYEMD